MEYSHISTRPSPPLATIIGDKSGLGGPVSVPPYPPSWALHMVIYIVQTRSSESIGKSVFSDLRANTKIGVQKNKQFKNTTFFKQNGTLLIKNFSLLSRK
jgi:hypothetical protein